MLDTRRDAASFLFIRGYEGELMFILSMENIAAGARDAILFPAFNLDDPAKSSVSLSKTKMVQLKDLVFLK